MSAERFERLRASAAYADLVATSARLGRDPLQVQGPGGNTSLKADGAMWVKASGTWLAEAEERAIMVPVEQAALRDAVLSDGAVRAADFVPEGLAAAGLRPSIETSVHAVLPQPVVLHTHCVSTIAVAIREDVEAVVRERLADLDPIVVPYVMPGEPLARALAAEAAPRRRVAVLGNHGLIAMGESVAEAAGLLGEVALRLAPDTVPEAPGEVALASERYRPAEAPALRAVAADPERLALAAGGPYYPDHVVFLGASLAVAEPGEDVEAAAERHGEAPALVVLPGRGGAIRRDAPAAAEAMARCLGDVIARVAPGAPVRALSAGEIAALLGWDAEKHRQALSAGRSA
ncbi:MAG: class II aldolase/adducin family protein [Paracoccaceae bacterium]